jgi:hypothetical protein
VGAFHAEIDGRCIEYGKWNVFTMGEKWKKGELGKQGRDQPIVT